MDLQIGFVNIIQYTYDMMPLVETITFPTARYPEVYTSAGRNRYVRGELSMIAALEQASSIKRRRRKIPFCGARPSGAFDAACWFSSVGVQEHVQPGDGTHIVFALAAHITDPCREVWYGDQFLSQPGEICDMP
jgi:hypothetical protein